MNSSFNPRMTVVIVFAVLFIAALFVGPGGPADQVVPPEAPASLAPAAKATSVAAANPASAWYSQEEPTPPAVSPSPANDPAAVSAPAPGSAPPAGGEPVQQPLPQGPDFPEHQ